MSGFDKRLLTWVSQMATKNHASSSFNNSNILPADNNQQYQNFNMNAINGNNIDIASKESTKKSKVQDNFDVRRDHEQLSMGHLEKTKMNSYDVSPIITASEKSNERKSKNDQKKNSSSTLSLHIAAYENNNGTASNDGIEEDRPLKTTKDNSKISSSSNLLSSSTTSPYPDIPRRQYKEASEKAENMPFQISQKMLDVYNSKTANLEKRKSRPETDLAIQQQAKKSKIEEIEAEFENKVNNYFFELKKDAEFVGYSDEQIKEAFREALKEDKEIQKMLQMIEDAKKEEEEKMIRKSNVEKEQHGQKLMESNAKIRGPGLDLENFPPKKIVFNVKKMIDAEKCGYWELFCSNDPMEIPLILNTTRIIEGFCIALSQELSVYNKNRVNEIVSLLSSCKINELTLVDQTMSIDTFSKLTRLETIKEVKLCNVNVYDRSGKLNIAAVFGQLQNVERIVLQSGEPSELGEELAEAPKMVKLKYFELKYVRDSLDLRQFFKFVKKHEQDQVHFVVKFVYCKNIYRQKYIKQAITEAELPCKVTAKF